jgi:hypothetical protein
MLYTSNLSHYFISIISIIILTGCSTMTSLKRVDYVAEKKITTKPISVVYLCRPSSFHMFATSFGVTVNQSPIGDLGSGEIMAITLPKTSPIYLNILVPDQNPIGQLLKKEREFGIPLTGNLSANYVIFTTSAGETNITGTGSPFIKDSGDYQITSSFGLRLQEVSPANFQNICPSKQMSYFTHKSL